MNHESRAKVFCVGFMKTGTTTMNRALSILGYKVSSKSWRLLHSILVNDWKKITRHIEEHDAFEDNPIPSIYKELDHRFPGSKFILTVRDPEKWYKSVSYHIGGLRSPMHEFVFGSGKSIPRDDRKHTITVFERHIEQVKEHFKDRPDSILIIDVTETNSWDQICDFLNEQVPEAEFPHSNRSIYSKPKNSSLKMRWKVLKRSIKNPLLISWYRMRGLLPSAEDRLS